MRNTCFIIFLLTLGWSAQAQTRSFDYTTHSINIWQGGQPGQEADWYTAANWSLQRVPDWTHDVLIPDMSATARPYPVIRHGAAEANSIQLQSGAQLSIADTGKLRLPEGTLVDATTLKGYLDTRFEPLVGLVQPTAMVPGNK